MVLAVVEQGALDLQRRDLPAAGGELGVGLGAFAADVDDGGVGVVDDLAAGRLLGPAVVDLLVVEEVARVEQADAVDDALSQQAVAAGHPVALAHRRVVPAHVVDQPGAAEDALEPGADEELVPRRREVAARRLQRAVAADQAHAEHADLGIRVEVADAALDAAGGDEGVGVEEQQIAATRQGERLVVRPSEADVLGVRDQFHVRVAFAQQGGGAVPGGIVDHDLLHRQTAGRRLDRGEHLVQQVRGVVVDDDDAEVAGHVGWRVGSHLSPPPWSPPRPAPRRRRGRAACRRSRRTGAARWRGSRWRGAMHPGSSIQLARRT